FLLLLLPSGVLAARLNERGEWVVRHGKDAPIHMSQCGLNVAMLALECFGVSYELPQVSAALPPTREGIRFSDVKTVLEAHGLACFARQEVDLRDVQKTLRPNTMAVFAVPGGRSGYNHYLLAIHHPQRGLLVLDPPNRPPVPLADLVEEELLQPVQG